MSSKLLCGCHMFFKKKKKKKPTTKKRFRPNSETPSLLKPNQILSHCWLFTYDLASVYKLNFLVFTYSFLKTYFFKKIIIRYKYIFSTFSRKKIVISFNSNSSECYKFFSTTEQQVLIQSSKVQILNVMQEAA